MPVVGSASLHQSTCSTLFILVDLLSDFYSINLPMEPYDPSGVKGTKCMVKVAQVSGSGVTTIVFQHWPAPVYFIAELLERRPF